MPRNFGPRLRSWRRQVQPNRLLPPPPVISGPPVSAGQPVGLRVVSQRTGVTFSTPALPQPPATFYPLNRPVTQARQPLPAPGRTASRAGTFGQTGPPFYALHRPAEASVRLFQPRGRVASRTGKFGQLGPPFYALNHPAAAVVRPLPARGRTAGRTGPFGQLGPAFYALDRPAEAVVRPLPPRGRTAGRSGSLGQLGPTFYPLRKPAAAGQRPLPQRGRVFSLSGTYGQLGPQFRPLPHPVQARQPLPPRGRAQGRTNVVAPAPFYALNRPCAAVVRPLPPRGRAQGRAGTLIRSGPPVSAGQPAGLRVIYQRVGVAGGSAGTFAQLGPPFYPLNRPVTQARQPLPPRGRAAGRAGTFTFVGPPPFYPLNHPAGAVVRPLPPRGTAHWRYGSRCAQLINTAEGGVSGVTVTAGNSGGASGSAFDIVGISSGATLAWDNTRAAHGLNSIKVATTTSGGADGEWSTSASWSAQMWFRMYLYFTANPGANHRVWEMSNGAGAVGGVLVNTTGHLFFVSSTGGVIFTFATAIPLNQWFRIEGFLIGNPSAGQVSLQRYDRPDSFYPAESQTSAATQNTNGIPNAIFMGVPTGNPVASVGPFWMDDIGIANCGPLGPSSTSQPIPLLSPVQARQPLPARGRTQSRAGTFSQTGSPFYALNRPVQARQPMPPRGRTAGRASVVAPAPFYPLNHPVQARQPLPPRGRAQGRTGVIAPPPFYPLNHPVRARLPQQPPPKGKVYRQSGTYQQIGPQLTPLRGPVRAAFRTLSPKGTAQGRAAAISPPPAFKGRSGPVFAFRTPPQRGRVYITPAYRPPALNLTQFYPLHHPVQARRPLPPHGVNRFTPPYARPSPLLIIGPVPIISTLLGPPRWDVFLGKP